MEIQIKDTTLSKTRARPENLPCEKLRKTSCAQKPKREIHRNRGKCQIKNVRNLQPTKEIIALMFKWLTIIGATYILLHDYLCSPLYMVMFIVFHLEDKKWKDGYSVTQPIGVAGDRLKSAPRPPDSLWSQSLDLRQIGRWAWRCTVILALGSLRLENLKFKASLCCIVRSCFKRGEETGKRRGKEEREGSWETGKEEDSYTRIEKVEDMSG